jgi:hypothetical protein
LVQSSTYGAEFIAMQTCIEELLALCYAMCSFGVLVSRASRIFGDNMSILLNISTPDSQLKKKNLVIAYHLVRENVAALVMEPFYIPSSQNFADFLTKQLASMVHEYHAKGLLYHYGLLHMLE